MKTVIMAGGRGTRIAQYNADVPKPMIPVFGKPILEYQIECLAIQGFTEIILVIGYLGQIIENHFSDGRRFGADISYIKEEVPLGMAGALFLLKDLLAEDFLLLNGDVIFDVDLNKFCESHRKMTASLATILIHPNDHPFDSGVVVADRMGRVIEWLHKEDERSWYKNSVNAGLHILAPQILKQFSSVQKVDLDRDVLKPLMADEKLFVYHSSEYIKDIGTPERLYEVTADIQKNIPRSKNLTQKQKAIFLDRDGTINREQGFLRYIDDFELIDGVAEAIKLINRSGYLAIVITNQPVVAKGHGHSVGNDSR